MTSDEQPPFVFVPTSKYYELGRWKYYLSSMSPERLEQQRQYDRARGKKYRQEHKDEMNKREREWYKENKDIITEKHVCETCGGRYTIKHKSQHLRTRKHQHALPAQTLGT